MALSTKDLFGAGMDYTGLSRQRTIERLFLKDLHVKKFYCDPNIENVLSRMKRLNTQMTLKNDDQRLNIVFHIILKDYAVI